MADDPNAVHASLRAQFAKNAVLPKKQIAAAEEFMNHVSAATRSGDKLTENDLIHGRSLLESIENQTEIFLFNAAILAGQEAGNEKDLDRKIAAISNGVTRAKDTTDRLRETLEAIA